MRLKREIGFIVAFLVVCVALGVYFGGRVQNIFDEIALDAQNDGLYLSRIDNFKYFEHKNNYNPEKNIYGFDQYYSKESYDGKFSDFHIHYDIDGVKDFSIIFSKPIEDPRVSITFVTFYSYEEKELSQYVNVVVEDDSGELVDISQDEAADILRRYGVDEDYIRDANREMLNDMFLTDWTVAYRSHYSPDDWGEVEVVEDYLKYFR